MTNCVVPYMLGISLIGLIRTRARYDRIVSWVMFFLLFVLFGIYTKQDLSGQSEGFSILWGYSQLGNIMLDYSPSHISNEIIIPFFFLNLLVVFNNNIFRYEERRSPVNAFIFLNFITIMLLICAKNYVQLITMVFISDIIGYLILRNVDSAHRYVIYNFFADMCLFTILSLACGKIQSLDISMLWGYDQIGRHKDFLSLVTALALFIKIGCLPFQTYLTDLKQVKFQRMIIVNLLTAPLMGIMLLIKLHNLLLMSDMFAPLFEVIVILTVMTGVIGFVIKNHIQKKLVYLNMVFFGLLLKVIQLNDFNWNSLLSLYYIAIYLFNMLFFKIYIYHNKETNITGIFNIKELNLPALKALLLQISWLCGCTLALALKISQKFENYAFFYGMCVAIWAISAVLNYIYIYSQQQKINIRSSNTSTDVSSIVFFSLLGYGTYKYQSGNFVELIIFITVFLVLTAIPQGKYLQKIYDQSTLQKTDLSKTFFSYVIASPIMHISRVLGLIIDFFLSEKVITASISFVEKIGTKLFSLINQKGKWSPLILILIGILLFFLTYYKKGGNL